VLLGLYYILPWLRWGDHQAVLFDLPARKFYIFGLTFWPQDFIYLAWLLVIAALTLFFFTALAGRLWCGYACPQTVWTELFLWIERKVEGDRSKQMKLDKSAPSANKFRIKATKHTLWLLLSAWTGFTFVGYFTPIVELWGSLFALTLGPWETFWIIFYGFATYGNAGWMREQVCIYMCPYARFQSAMFDRDTLIISYDEKRGEPRGSRKRAIDHRAAGMGDCKEGHPYLLLQGPRAYLRGLYAGLPVPGLLHGQQTAPPVIPHFRACGHDTVLHCNCCFPCHLSLGERGKDP